MMNARPVRLVLAACLLPAWLLAAPASTLAQGTDLDAGADDDAGMLPAQSPITPSGPLVTLPPARPEPEIAPVVNEQEPVRPTPPLVASADRPGVLIKTILGLLTLITLAFLGGHRRVLQLERKLGISQLITAGFPFVMLGWLARTPSVGILNDALLAELSPLLRIGLGYIGFVTGFRFGTQPFPTTALMRMASFATAVPFASVALPAGLLLLWISGDISGAAASDPVFLRDAVILGTAGAMTATSSVAISQAQNRELLWRVLRLEELAGVIGMAVIAAYFRPELPGGWQLPGTAWLLLTLGLGATLGVISFLILNRSHEQPEFVLLTLGLVGFNAGTAGYLRLSPVVIAFIAGTGLALLPELPRDRVRAALRRLERPIYLLSLTVIGALWRIGDWRGWALVPIFTVARLIGKRAGIVLGSRSSGLQLSREQQDALAISPIGALAIAIVVNAQLLYPGGSISPIVGAVIVGGMLTEVVVQLATRRPASEADPATGVS